MAVGVFFLDAHDPRGTHRAQVLAEAICARRGFSVAGWRDVPLDREVLGAAGSSTMPDIKHLLLVDNQDSSDLLPAEQRLFLGRKELEGRLRAESLDANYVVSLSSRTIVYKGLIVGTEVGHFFQRGNWLSRSGCWRTTARSTRLTVTATGCSPAKVGWSILSSARTRPSFGP